MSFQKGSCIHPGDTNRTIKATFKFIKEYQGLEEGIDTNTRLYLGLASLKELNLNDYKLRNTVFNNITGKIIDALDHEVVMEVPFEGAVAIYTVSYSEIQNLQNDLLIKYKDEFLAYMDKLPPLCKCEGNRYYDILVPLNWEVLNNQNNQDMDFVVMYGGGFSGVYKAMDIVVVRNLIFIINGIIPVTYVMGYFTTKELD
ncbi:MAG: hypothetical protein ACRC2K_06140 [Clostridium sp.]